MRLRLFRAPRMAEAMAQVRAALGDDAVILSTRRVAGGVEVMAALDDAAEAEPWLIPPGAPAGAAPVAAGPAEARPLGGKPPRPLARHNLPAALAAQLAAHLASGPLDRALDRALGFAAL